MNLQPWPWHGTWVASVRGQVAAHHHAWILTGRSGDGLSQAGHGLAASLLCEAPQQGLACGTCSSCRWLTADAHPDFFHLRVETAEPESTALPTIKVDQARDAIAFMQLSAGTERGRVIVIDPADALTQESGNAILKALEEPPVNTRWLLLTERVSRLLPTLRSRALRLSLPRPSRKQAAAFLAAQGIAAEQAEAALIATRQAPLTALEWAQRPGWMQDRARFLADLARPGQLPTLAWGAWVEAGGKGERRERFAAALDWLLGWLVEGQRICAGMSPCLPEGEALCALRDRIRPEEWLRYHRKLLRQLHLPDTTLSARLQLEAILLDYRSLFSR